MEAGRWTDYLTPRAAVGSQKPPREKNPLGAPMYHLAGKGVHVLVTMGY